MKSEIIINGKSKTVKNLGWLLRNWKIIESFEIGTGDMTHFECVLRANFKGGYYITDYANYMVLQEFLKRPVFYGLPVVDFYKQKEYNITK